ncbi:hypothetical protein [Natrinema salsiterrestre]|uniref:DUF8135 domain-containing protein n=1 Tax=Natrinema salsiterrestre TaxID=2950540 RepID=A0A9Q4L3J2_9EURY|nr:hypothetical protein [Natrinema salsiterrestre]MDF9746932.1 hypothetical protein [Natrinema salsiterrestre]
MTDRSDPNDDTEGTEFTHDDDRDSAADADAGRSPETPDRSAPLGELAATVGESDGSDRSQSSAPDFDDLFDRQETTEIDGDRLWERLEGDELDEQPRSAEREIREVEKRSYCQDCEHFSDPPDVACGREGTDILAVPTMTTFRVADCPFVLEDEALEGER